MALIYTQGPVEIRTDCLQLIIRMTKSLRPGCFRQPPGHWCSDVFCMLSQLVKSRQVYWSYVKSHNRDYGNDQADMLAKMGRNRHLLVATLSRVNSGVVAFLFLRPRLDDFGDTCTVIVPGVVSVG